MTLIAGVQFGNRTGYSPVEADEGDEHRAMLDAQYIETNQEELNICMRYVRIAHEELSTTIASILEKPVAERGMGSVPQDLHDRLVELYNARHIVQSNVGYYAKLVIEIEERIARGQRYLVEHPKEKRA